MATENEPIGAMSDRFGSPHPVYRLLAWFGDCSEDGSGVRAELQWRFTKGVRASLFARSDEY
jgi:hypothetical protein